LLNHGRWFSLSKQLLKNNEPVAPLGYTPIERWQVILVQIMLKVKKQRNSVGWLETFDAAKNDLID